MTHYKLEIDQVEHLKHLKTSKGLPVPYVVRWTGQQTTDTEMGMSVPDDGDPFLRYKNGPENRDSFDGRLWMREGLNRTGEPEWGQVSAYFQRNCMTRRFCQVCGQKIQLGPINWIMAGDIETSTHTSVSPSGELTTFNPPTCDRCVPVAKAVCPALATSGYHHYLVREYELWGTSGDLIHTENIRLGPPLDPWLHNVLLPYTEQAAGKVKFYVAKQTVVRFTDFDVVVP